MSEQVLTLRPQGTVSLLPLENNLSLQQPFDNRGPVRRTSKRAATLWTVYTPQDEARRNSWNANSGGSVNSNSTCLSRNFVQHTVTVSPRKSMKHQIGSRPTSTSYTAEEASASVSLSAQESASPPASSVIVPRAGVPQSGVSAFDQLNAPSSSSATALPNLSQPSTRKMALDYLVN